MVNERGATAGAQRNKGRMMDEYLERTMATQSSGGRYMWALWLALGIILVLGSGLSVVAYMEGDVTIVESIIAGFVAVGAVIVALVAAAAGLVIGVVGALVGIITAGGALAVTAFVILSPIIALVLLWLLLRDRKRATAYPDLSAHD